jgi:hypothetical protein
MENKKRRSGMKRKLSVLAAMVFVLTVSVAAQQGQYTRKSVSSLESVWYKPGSLEMSFDQKTFDKFMKFYVEVERFDYNVLPQTYINDFVNTANNLDIITNTTLSEVLNATVGEKIKAILNDPEVMQARGNELKSEASAKSFAATKAKSVGLTAKELETLFNSAYIYLPFISKASSETDDKGIISVTLEGGIIWWHLVIAKDGSTRIEELVSATTMGMSSVDPNSKKNILTGSPVEFRFGNERWSTTPEQWAQNDAMLAFTKNLGVKTKEIDDFKLTAQIAEAKGKKYGFPLGLREGVHMDDGFHIVEFEEDQDGNEVAVRKGFVRVAKTGKNQDDPTQLSYAKQLIGKPVSEGSVVMEHPRLGMDIRYNGGIVVGSVIRPEHTSWWPLIPEPILKTEANSQIGMNMIISYNLAPVIGISQTFIDVDLGFGLPVAEYSEDATAFAYVASGYFGLTKKFGGRLFLSASAGVGVDALALTGKVKTIEDYVTYYTETEHDFTIMYNAAGVKAYGEIGYMLSADMHLFANAGYKFGMAPLVGTLTWDDVDYEFPVTDPEYSDLNLGGLMVNVGVSYALGELPINIFGFLDPFKKY